MSECANEEMRDLLPELVSGRLSAEMRLAAEAHVAECEECTQELALLRALRPALLRGPAIDTQRIAAAVRAQVPATAQRGSSRRAMPWRLAMAAAALIAVSAGGYVIATRAKRVAPEVAVTPSPDSLSRDSTTPTPVTAPSPVPKAPLPRSAIVPSPRQQVAVAPPHVVAPNEPNGSTTVASAGVLDNVSDLSDDDVRTLSASLDGMSAVPSAEPAPEIDPLGATLEDQSAGESQ